MSVVEVTELLAGEYGNRTWSRRSDPLSELVMTILSQNTSDHNSRLAFSSLIDTFGDWRGVAAGSVEAIAEAIKTGGLAKVKAPRIKKILERIQSERDSLDLAFLGELTVNEARSWLQSLPGVGPKTAACVLLFSLGEPVLPVDTHVHRVAKRLGLIDEKTSAEKAHEILGEMVPDEDIYRFHIMMIEHGRRVCKAQHPRCLHCVLLRICPTGTLMAGSILEHGVKA